MREGSNIIPKGKRQKEAREIDRPRSKIEADTVKEWFTETIDRWKNVVDSSDLKQEHKRGLLNSITSESFNNLLTVGKLKFISNVRFRMYSYLALVNQNIISAISRADHKKRFPDSELKHIDLNDEDEELKSVYELINEEIEKELGTI